MNFLMYNMASVLFGTLFVVYFCSLVPGLADDDIPDWLESILSAPRARSHHKHQTNDLEDRELKLLDDLLTRDEELNELLLRYKASHRRSWIIDDPGNRATEGTPSTQSTPPSTGPPPQATTPQTTAAPTTQSTAATTGSRAGIPSRPSWWPTRFRVRFWRWGKRKRRSDVIDVDLEDDDVDKE